MEAPSLGITIGKIPPLRRVLAVSIKAVVLYVLLQDILLDPEARGPIWYTLDPTAWGWSWYLGIWAVVSEMPSARKIRTATDWVFIVLALIAGLVMAVGSLIIWQGGMLGNGLSDMLNEGIL
jgi:hypothetical protein